MNARMKLNSGYLQGSFVLAVLAGWLAGSWLVFIAFLLVWVVCALHSGDIRLEPSARVSRLRDRR